MGDPEGTVLIVILTPRLGKIVVDMPGNLTPMRAVCLL